MINNFVFCKDISENPTKWGIVDREKDRTLNSDNGEEIVEVLNQLYEDNKQYKILVESLKDENEKLKLKLKDLGVEYY